MAGTNYSLVAIGNPLLDMQVRDGEEMLKKYDLKSNDAILAEEKHMPIYKEIVEKYQITYVAGGAAQNAARAAAYVLPPHSTAYLGCVGDDDFAQQLRNANDREGLHSAYQVAKGVPTGTCAVILTGVERSLVTNLGAAEKFSPSHLDEPEVKQLIAGAKHFYLGGFFLTHGLESASKVAQHAVENNKTFAMNLSAPFLPQFFKDQIDAMIQYADIVFGNESEAEAWAQSHGLETKDIATIASAIATQPAKHNRQRHVVITQGASSTIVATASKDDTSKATTKTYPVTPLAREQIVDTNGAGDAFSGGFIGAWVAGKNVDEAVEAGHKLGRMCIQLVGPQLKYPKETIL